MKPRRKQHQEKAAPKRIAAYIRVSSQRQVTEGDSLTAQKNQIERTINYRKDQGEWKVEGVQEYIDAGKSAKNQNRPELQRLKRDIEAGKIDLVICFKIDRITRSLADFVELWSLFSKHGVEVISLHENFDTTTPIGKLMLVMVMAFAELEREQIGERTYAIMQDRAERGLWNGGHILGYASDKTDRGKLLVDPEGAVIVKKIFNLLEETGSAGAVTRKLQELQIKYPTYETRAGKVRGGKGFSKQKVVGILRNKIYLGHIHWGEQGRQNSHAPLISEEQFQRVQQRLDHTTRARGNSKQPKGRLYPLTGLLCCQCGSSLVGSAAHGKNDVYYYYSCTRQSHESGKNSCHAPRYPAEALEQSVWNRIRELAVIQESQEKIVAETLQQFHHNEQNFQQDEERGRRQLSTLRAEKGRLIEILKSPGFKALTSLQTELEKLEQEEVQLSAQVHEFATRSQPYKLAQARVDSFIRAWQDLPGLVEDATIEQRREVMQQCIEQIRLEAADSKCKQGRYWLKLFPELQPQADDPNFALTLADPAVLTAERLSSDGDRKAPRQGLEPWT